MDMAAASMYWMGVYAVLDSLLPPPLRLWIHRKTQALRAWLFHGDESHLVTLRIPDSSEGHSNHAFRHSHIYLSSLHASLRHHNHVDVLRLKEHGHLSFHLPAGMVLEDTFRGIVVRWTKEKTDEDGNGYGDGLSGTACEEYFTLQFPVIRRSTIVPDYLEHITRTAMEIQRRSTQLNLYRNKDTNSWKSVPFTHPSTFDSLALDTELRRRILDDLHDFCNSQDRYHRLGRAWKRGYLLHGPPGTGKTSLIAAIANYLHYDVYDLELTGIYDNDELKSLLMKTRRKSIIVIEDIDCSFRFAERRHGRQEGLTAKGSNNMTSGGGAASMADNGGGSSGGAATAAAAAAAEKQMSAEIPRLTLSGLLDFTGGLWSGCVEERIFIFTTNVKERLEPALLRPGRMDMHILLSYCTFSAVEKLADIYLGLGARKNYRDLLAELEEAARGPHTVTPAHLTEIFISHRAEGPEAALVAAIHTFRTSARTLIP